MRKLSAVLISCFLVLAAYLAVGLDNWVGSSQNVAFEAFFVSIGIVVGGLAFIVGQHKAFLVAPSAFVLFMLALPVIDLGPVKPALRAVHEIHPGMSESEVRGVLERHFPEHGRIKRPEFGAVRQGVLSFVLDPTDGRYNAAVVQVKFAAGKCVTAEFLPD